MALGLTLRLAGRDHGLFRDEFFTLEDVQPSGFADLLDRIANGPEMTPPLYFVVLWPLSKVGRPDLWWALPSLVPGVAIIPALFSLGRRLAGDAAGLIAAAIAACGANFLVFSVELRPYMLLSFILVASTIALLKALDGSDRRWWAIYAVLGSLALWTHYTGGFILLGQGLWVLRARPSARRSLVIASAGSLVLFLPWIPLIGKKEGLSWYVDANRWNAMQLFKTIPGEQFMPAPPAGTAGYLSGRWLLLYAFWVLAIAAVALAARAVRESGRSDGAVGLVGAAAVSMPAAMGIQTVITGDGVFTPRHLFAFVPYAAALLGWALVTVRPRIGILLGVPLAAILLVSTASHFSQAARKPPYWPAAQLIAERSGKDDIVIDALPGMGRRLKTPLEYLDPGSDVIKAETMRVQILLEAAKRHATVWIVLQQDSRGPGLRMLKRFRSHGYRITNVKRFRGSVEFVVIRMRPEH